MAVDFKVDLIPSDGDVWEEIESIISTGLTDVYQVDFYYTAEDRITSIVIRHRKEDLPNTEVITIKDIIKAENLVIKLCNKFNIPWRNLRRLDFKLLPEEVPVFNVDLYPYVKRSLD